MTISVPLTRRAKKQAEVIQCVTRTSRVCRRRRVPIRAVVSVAGTESATRECYHFRWLHARIAETNWRKPIVDGLRQLPASNAARNGRSGCRDPAIFIAEHSLEFVPAFEQPLFTAPADGTFEQHLTSA